MFLRRFANLTANLLFLLLVARAVSAASDTGHIAGKVVDAQGRPIANATVTLFPWGKLRAPERTALSNARGQFRAEGLAPGEWNLTWKARGYFEKYSTRPESGYVWGRVPTLVVVKPGQSADVELVMLAMPILYGQVRDPAGALVTNEHVWLRSPGGGFHIPVSGTSIKVWCDAYGFYKHAVSWEGEDSLGVSRHNDQQYSRMQKFRLTSGKRTRVDFRLLRGARVWGQVLGVDGKAPIAGARVYISDGSELPRFSGRGGDVKTDADGRFEMELVPGVEYKLAADGGAYEYETIPEEHSVVRLRDGEHRRGLKMLLRDRKPRRHPSESRNGHPIPPAFPERR